jgi:translation initiation factor IF-2
MQQRRVRLGDILDDYCPRERRITNHAVVAMLEDRVKQTRCTTCDADHEYRDGKLPAPRRRKGGAADGVLVDARPRRVPANGTEPVDLPDEELARPDAEDDGEPAQEQEPLALVESGLDDADAGTPHPPDSDEWPVHRPLIRATLPRPEGQTPERKTPDFTMRSTGGRFDAQRNGQRKGGHRPMRHAQGQPSGPGRFGGPRTGSGSGPRHGAGSAHGQGQGQGQGQRQGNRSGTAGGGNRAGANRGPRPAGGRKRGR